MKDQKNDSTPVLARFGRDKRVRTVKATAERVERRPRSQRDAADSEQPYREQPAGRASYNPHFTADNRPAFDRPRGERPQRDSGPVRERSVRAVRSARSRMPSASVPGRTGSTRTVRSATSRARRAGNPHSVRSVSAGSPAIAPSATDRTGSIRPVTGSAGNPATGSPAADPPAIADRVSANRPPAGKGRLPPIRNTTLRNRRARCA